MENIIYTVSEVSKIIKSNPNYVYELINAGLLPALKLGSMKVTHKSLIAFLTEYEGMDLTDPTKVKKLKTTDNAFEGSATKI